MKFTTKIKNTKTSIKQSIFLSFLPKNIIYIFTGIILTIIMIIVIALTVASRNPSSVETQEMQIGTAINGDECFSAIGQVNSQKLCIKDLTCFVPLTNSKASDPAPGKCISLPKIAGIGEYCTNSSNGPNCDSGSSCQFVKTWAKCIKPNLS